jgi:hypothetical protein
METVYTEERRKNMVFANMFRKKSVSDIAVAEGVEIVKSMVDVMDREPGDTDSFIVANRILEIENRFENYERTFLNSIEGMRPVCMEEFWKINRALKGLVQQFATIFNKNQVFKNKESYKIFYDYQKKFLDNVTSFFTDYLNNRKYVYEVLRNNQLELKNFMNIYFSRMNTVSCENVAKIESRMKILEIFEDINQTNEKIQNSMNKIYVATCI